MGVGCGEGYRGDSNGWGGVQEPVGQKQDGVDIARMAGSLGSSGESWELGVARGRGDVSCLGGVQEPVFLLVQVLYYSKPR